MPTLDQLFPTTPTMGTETEPQPAPDQQQDQGPDRLAVFVEAEAERQRTIQRLAEAGRYGTEIQQAERIKATTPALIKQAKEQGFSPEMIADLQKKADVAQQQFVPSQQRASVKDFEFTDENRNILGQTIEIAKDIQTSLTEEYKQRHRGAVPPAATQERIKAISENLAVKIRKDPTYTAIVREAYAGVKLIADVAMVGASGIYNSGKLLTYVANSVEDLATASKETMYDRSGKELLAELTKTYMDIHDSVVPDSFSNARVTQMLFREFEGVDLPEHVANKLVDINRESAGAGARLGQFFAGSIGINGALTATRKIGGRVAQKQLEKYYKDTWSVAQAAETGQKAVPLKSLDKASYAKLVDDFVDETTGVGYRFKASGESFLQVSPYLRDIARIPLSPFGKAVKRGQLREAAYQQEAKRAKEVARRIGRRANLNPLAARINIYKQQQKKVNDLYRKQNQVYANGDYKGAAKLHEQIASAEAKAFGYKTGLVTPATQNMVLSEIGAYVGFETANQFDAEGVLPFLMILGGAFMGPSAIPFGIEKTREYVGRAIIRATRSGTLFKEINKNFDLADIERALVGKTAAKFFYTDAEGKRKFASPQQRQFLETLRNTLDKHGMSDQVATRMARLGQLQDDLAKLGVDQEKFQLTIDQLTGLTPLIALRETAKAKKSLTNAFGRLRVDELVNQVEIVKLEAEAIMQIRKALDDLLPEDLPEGEVSALVDQFRTGAAALVEDRFVFIREDIRAMKGLIANLQNKDRSVPALLRGDVDDEDVLTKLSDLESKLTSNLAKVDARIGGGRNERLIPALDQAADDTRAVAGAVEEATEATGRVLKHNFKEEKPQEPLLKLIALARRFKETVDADYKARFTRFFQEVQDVKGTDPSIADKLYDIVDRDYSLAEILAGGTAKTSDIGRLVQVTEEFYQKAIIDYARKNNFDPDEVADQVREAGGFYRYYKELEADGNTLPAVEIPVEDLDYIRRGINRMRGRIDDRQAEPYKELGDAIDNDIDAALNRYDLEKQGVTVKDIKAPVREGTAARFAELRKGYLEDVIARADTRLGRLLDKNRHYSEKPNLVPADFNFLKLDDAIKNEAKALEVFEELSRFFGGPIREGEAVVRRELNPETTFQLRTLDPKTGEEAVSNYQVGAELREILVDMQKESLGRLPVFRGVRVDEGDIGTAARQIGEETPTVAASLQEARISTIFNGLLDPTDDALTRSLRDAAENNKTLSNKIIEQKQTFVTIRDEFLDQFRRYENIERMIDQTLARRVAGVRSVDELADELLRPTSAEIGNIRTLIDGLSETVEGVSRDEVLEVLRDAVSKRLKRQIFSGDTAIDPEGNVARGFDYTEFSRLIDESAENLKVIFDDKHLEDLKGVADIMSVILAKVDAPSGVGTYQIKTLSPSSIMSRIYAVSRGVVSFRYVASEAALLIYGRNRQDELISMMNDPALADIFFKVLTSRRPLPANETKPQMFLRALARASAYEETQGDL
jgi:hypothetical protein